MRTAARPTAEMETRVPMQYFITSYFPASNWARKAWISWNNDVTKCQCLHWTLTTSLLNHLTHQTHPIKFVSEVRGFSVLVCQLIPYPPEKGCKTTRESTPCQWFSHWSKWNSGISILTLFRGSNPIVGQQWLCQFHAWITIIDLAYEYCKEICMPSNT